MNIMVTGAKGYIGAHVVSYLVNKGHRVLASDIDYVSQHPLITAIETPIFGCGDDIYEVSGEPDVLIHLAYRNGFKHNHESHLEDLYRHYGFVTKMIEGGLKSVTVMGSMHEIGYIHGEINENTETHPGSLYGIAKNALREALFCYLSGKKDVSFKWTRGYYITGDDERASSIFFKIKMWEKDGKETFPFTSGKNKYDFIDVDELAAQISETAIQTEINGIIECCSGNPVSLADKVEQFISDNGFKIRPEYGAFPDREYDSPAVWGSTEKIVKIMQNAKNAEEIR